MHEPRSTWGSIPPPPLDRQESYIVVNNVGFCNCIIAIEDVSGADNGVKYCFYRKSDVPDTPKEELQNPTLNRLTICPICDKELDWDEIYAQAKRIGWEDKDTT